MYKYQIISNVTKAYHDQNAGTSGLRKKTSYFLQPNYVENYIQSICNALEIENKSVIIGGDGRYLNTQVLQTIISMCIANKAKHILISKNGILSTPATSVCIREKKIDLAIILSASHNPAGIDGDFGIKVNNAEGAPLDIKFTDKIYNETKKISSFNICVNWQDLDISELKSFTINNTEIEIFNSVDIYTTHMKTIFDFSNIKSLVSGGFNFYFNALHGSTGQYAYKIFHEELGVAKQNLFHINSLEDFGKLIADPNPVTAKDFVNKMKTKKSVDFVGMCDADGDRNFVFTKNYNIDAADSLAVILNNYKLLDYYKNINGVARSKATPAAVDLVAKKYNLNYFEVPTGWKFFANLMNNNLANLCVEESFGLGSFHSREKDGIWAILAWLNIIAVSQNTPDNLLENLWKEYGRYFYTRYDYEGLSTEIANQIIGNLNNIEKNYQGGNVTEEYKIALSSTFNYQDPTNGEKVENQGLEIQFSNNLSLFVRTSGTGTSGTTIRIYACIYSNDKTMILKNKDIIFKDVPKLLAKLIHNNQPTFVL